MITLSIRTVSVFLQFVLVLFFAQSALAECTKDQAFNKMMALGRAKQEIQKSEGFGAVTDLSVDIASVGAVLGEKKYGLACDRYDAIAAKYKINLEQKQKGLVTMEDIRKDGGKKNGKCSQADATKKMMGYLNQLEDRAALGDAERTIISEYSNDVQKFGDLIYTNPSQYCTELDKLKPKYSLK